MRRESRCQSEAGILNVIVFLFVHLEATEYIDARFMSWWYHLRYFYFCLDFERPFLTESLNCTVPETIYSC